MAEPLRDVLHGDAVMAEKSRAGVVEVVEPDPPHAVVIEELPEVGAHPVRPHEVAVLEDVDVAIEPFVVAAPEKLLHLVLLEFLLQKQVDGLLAKRHRAEGGVILRSLLEEQLVLPIDEGLEGRVLDGHRPVLEVNGVPFEADDLLPPQAIVDGQMDRQLQIRPLGDAEELLNLADVVEAAFEGFLLGPIDPVGDVIDHKSPKIAESHKEK